MAFLNALAQALGGGNQLAPFNPNYGALEPFSISGPANVGPAMLAQLPTGAAQPQQQQHKGGGLMNILGMLGDSIMAAHGGERLYEQQHQKQQLNGALQNFLTDPDGAIAQVMQFDAPTAISLYKMVHPTNETPSSIREWQLIQQMPEPQRSAYMDYKRSLVPSMSAPLTIPGNAQIEMPGATGESAATVNSQAEYDALPPGTPYIDSAGNHATKGGGASQPGSRTFP